MAIITKATWGREQTAEELTVIHEYITTQVSAGTTDGINYAGLNGNVQTILRTWSTTDAANAYVSFVNTVNPAPTSAVVA